MTIGRDQLIKQFGDAAELGNGALFIGAGLSQDASLPGWVEMIDALRLEARIPEDEFDAPLVAEYIADRVGRPRLNQHVLEQIGKGVPWKGTKNHELISRLGLKEIWTTNYDRFLETACSGSTVVCEDSTVQKINSGTTTVLKIHGSISEDGKTWVKDPVLTRGDYERYEDLNRRIWTLLHATYLSRTLLFLGFSFTDPNVELLQKLARRYGTAAQDRHLAVMRRPSESHELRKYEFQRDDLERSGITICEVDRYTEITEILASLEVHTRPPRVFVSGSASPEDVSHEKLEEACHGIALGVADNPVWEVVSLGGPAGWQVSREVTRIRRISDCYDPSHIIFQARKKEGQAEALKERIGTVVHSDLERSGLVHQTLLSCRAMLCVGGGERTEEEISWALQHDVGVVPLAYVGGAARKYWERMLGESVTLGGQPVTTEQWRELGSEEPTVALRTASKLLKIAMFTE